MKTAELHRKAPNNKWLEKTAGFVGRHDLFFHFFPHTVDDFLWLGKEPFHISARWIAAHRAAVQQTSTASHVWIKMRFDHIGHGLQWQYFTIIHMAYSTGKLYILEKDIRFRSPGIHLWSMTCIYWVSTYIYLCGGHPGKKPGSLVIWKWSSRMENFRKTCCYLRCVNICNVAVTKSA